MDAEYYILCPQRPENAPGLITHLISVDICRKRQAEGFHKCPNCVRSDIWKMEHERGTRPAPVK
ncbi:MAG: hypothetical protein MUE73_02085 [Planctomycetes bacterium]|nr:hypothetical protein [Planctomycetota bacterium]